VTGPATITHLQNYQWAKWEKRAKGLAREVRSWSSCVRDQVGAVVIDPSSWDVVSTGFNDTAPGLPNCGQGGCPRAFRAGVVPGATYLDEDECLHAEDNALQRAGTRARGAWLVATRTPCGNCRRRALTAGIARIVIDQEDPQ
jgi:dCMP deaminase